MSEIFSNWSENAERNAEREDSMFPQKQKCLVEIEALHWPETIYLIKSCRDTCIYYLNIYVIFFIRDYVYYIKKCEIENL